MGITHKETARLLRIALDQATRLSANESVYSDMDWRGFEDIVSVDYFDQYLAKLQRAIKRGDVC